MRARPLLPLLAVVLAAAPFALAVGVNPAAAATTPPPAPSFSAPLTLNDAAGNSTGGSEPSIAVDSHDNIFVSAPAGVPSGGCPFWYVHSDGTSYDYRGTIDTDQGSVGGGDCDISTLPVTGSQNDDVSVTSLSLANLTSNVTTDAGATWKTVANSASQQIFGVDRQWQASDPVLGRHYLTVHDVATTNIHVSVSTDGGYQYVQNSFAIDPRTNSKALTAGGVGFSTVTGGNHFGALVVDPSTHHLFIPFLAPLEGTAAFNENTFYIAEGDPCPNGACTTAAGTPSPISWTSYEAFTAPAADNLANDFPALTIDAAGTLYAAFTGAVTQPSSASDVYSTNRIFVLHAPTPHTASGSWSTPQAVDPGTGHSNVFPWLVAGSAGNVGVAWYGSVLSGTACPGAGATGDATSVNDNCLNVWHVGYAQSSDASAPRPTYTASAITGTVHKGPICNQGLNCASGTRTLLDFFDVAMDSQGRANLVYASDTRSLNTADVQFTRQCSGTSLTGEVLAGCSGNTVLPTACAFNGAYTDPAGDASSVQGTSTPAPSDDAFDIVSGSLSTTTDGVVLSVKLKDLTNTPDGQIVEQHFKIAGKEFYVMAQRSTGGSAVSYVYGDMPVDPTTGVASRNQLGTTTGTFDDTTDLVTTLFPREATTPALADGAVISDVIVTTRRDGVVLIPDVDTAKSGCPYVVGAVDAAPVTPEVPYAALLPILGVVLMGLLYRRRRKGAGIA